MDSLTQATLGASLAVVCAPRAPTGRMILYGALAGTLPDLDVLASPFVSDVQSFAGHRSATHSLLVLPLAATLLAWGAAKLKLAGLGFRNWWGVLLAALVTHPLLDLMTSYGTQLLWPVSRYPFSTSSIYIIDPLYTVPLLIALWLVYRASATSAPDSSPARSLANRRIFLHAALIWGCFYLLCGGAAKILAAQTLRSTLPVSAQMLSAWQVQAALPGIFSWRAIAVSSGTTYSTVIYFWQSPQQVRWQSRPQHPHRPALVALMKRSAEHNRLMQFSKGLFHLHEQDRCIFYSDLRFAPFGQDSIFTYEVACLSPDDKWVLLPPKQQNYQL